MTDTERKKISQPQITAQDSHEDKEVWLIFASIHSELARMSASVCTIIVLSFVALVIPMLSLLSKADSISNGTLFGKLLSKSQPAYMIL
jgi:hypothetical protein